MSQLTYVCPIVWRPKLITLPPRNLFTNVIIIIVDVISVIINIISMIMIITL